MTTTVRRSLPGPGETVDVLIVGGGITGAAIAYEAASRGLSVALVEKGDFGAATSAATGKLIHGGLRYLKNLEVGLVRESLAERRTLSRIASGLVFPIAMVLPDPGLIEHVGLTAYDVLSFDRNRVAESHRIPRHRSLSRDELRRRGLGHLERGIRSLPCLGDGRQSGTSGSPSIVNASPEAAAGGGLALLRTGDRIRIDLNKCEANVLLSNAELEARRRALAEKSYPTPASQTPWQEIQRALVDQLSEGMVLRPAVKYRHIAATSTPRDSH